jgi:hypothetical protein
VRPEYDDVSDGELWFRASHHDGAAFREPFERHSSAVSVTIVRAERPPLAKVIAAVLRVTASDERAIKTIAHGATKRALLAARSRDHGRVPVRNEYHDHGGTRNWFGLIFGVASK